MSISKAFYNVIETIATKKREEGLTEQEISSFIEDNNVVGKLFNKIPKAGTSAVELFKNEMFKNALYWRAEDNEFLCRLEQKWGNCFVASEALYRIILEIIEEYNKRVEELDEGTIEPMKNKYCAMQYIHGRALQQYYEILSLLRNGFADGAFSRWRSMYELTVICQFLFDEGEEISQAFIEAAETEDRYEWARSSPKIKSNHAHITFSDIEKTIEAYRDTWRNDYVLANRTVHASPQGTFYRIGGYQDTQLIIGRSDMGFELAAERAAISLSRISVLYLRVFDSLENVLSSTVIINWIDVIRDLYFKAHDDIFPEEEKLYDDWIKRKEERESET